MMFHDTRSPYEKARDSERCPTCGHRPQDAVDEAQRVGSGGSYSSSTCQRCGGSGFEPQTTAAPCRDCLGTGRITVPNRANP